MKKLQVVMTVVLSLFISTGIVYAVTRNVTSTLGGATGDIFEVSGGFKVASLTVGSQGTGGVTFFNGTIVNNTTTSGVNNPVTFGDNVRIDGEIYRGSTAGTADSQPLKINDNVSITGNLTLGGTLPASSVSYSNAAGGFASTTVQGALDELKGMANMGYKAYTGTFDVSTNGDEITTETSSIDCANPANATYTKYTYYHWKKFAVPEVNLDRMPSIKVYNKMSEDLDFIPLVENAWIEMGVYSLTAYTSGYVHMLYKYIYEDCDGTTEDYVFLDGDYKIVLIY
ncbi:MAG: hypothetical protein ABIH38_03405 [Patescibacteria group bacterium]